MGEHNTPEDTAHRHYKNMETSHKDPESKPKPSSYDTHAAKILFFKTFHSCKHIFNLNYYISLFAHAVFLRFLGSFGSQNSSKQNNNRCPEGRGEGSPGQFTRTLQGQQTDTLLPALQAKGLNIQHFTDVTNVFEITND